ncbi:MAG: hypothetical protein NPIRA02_03670 [Nitrospirales bacterium]|nr:MAG: hypothetical protein NPIRA02_03670 [Nitrospirales bacterium]
MWYGVLVSMTLAYIIALFGVRAGKRHDIPRHAKWMMASCTLVGLWLAGYVAKQVMFGRDEFPGTVDEYWQYYIPVLVLHTSLAVATIGLGITNLYTGLTRLRLEAEVENLVNVIQRHRIQGKILVGTFSGTIVTAYAVYVMLFQWVPSQ